MTKASRMGTSNLVISTLGQRSNWAVYILRLPVWPIFFNIFSHFFVWSKNVFKICKWLLQITTPSCYNCGNLSNYYKKSQKSPNHFCVSSRCVFVSSLTIQRKLNGKIALVQLYVAFLLYTMSFCCTNVQCWVDLDASHLFECCKETKSWAQLVSKSIHSLLLLHFLFLSMVFVVIVTLVSFFFASSFVCLGQFVNEYFPWLFFLVQCAVQNDSVCRYSGLEWLSDSVSTANARFV